MSGIWLELRLLDLSGLRIAGVVASRAQCRFGIFAVRLHMAIKKNQVKSSYLFHRTAIGIRTHAHTHVRSSGSHDNCKYALSEFLRFYINGKKPVIQAAALLKNMHSDVRDVRQRKRWSGEGERGGG